MNLAENRVGEADVSVVVGRRLFPLELYVSHCDTKEKRWKIDDCTSDVRYSDTNQKDLFRALYEREMRMSDLRNAEVEANAAWQRKGRLND